MPLICVHMDSPVNIMHWKSATDELIEHPLCEHLTNPRIITENLHELDSVIRYVEGDDFVSRDVDIGDTGFESVSSDPIATMGKWMQIILNENEELRSVSELERIVKPMYSDYKSPRGA
ncbi:hypothetical protein GGR58DRAFT_507913 [Xylaria digitata]|nr:hypothetical protein GGR58DRAFT_507913 [Xylaria digitata]